MYDISNSVGLMAPRKIDRPCYVNNIRVAIYVDTMHVGLRFPMQSFFHKVLCALGLAPMQLSVNAYCFVAVFYVLYQKIGLGEPSHIVEPCSRRLVIVANEHHMPLI